MAASFHVRIQDIARQAEAAAAQAESDAGASAALKAVVAEFREKTQKAASALASADERALRDHVIEAEQAADSAKRAAQADDGISRETRQAVLESHAALCALKSELLEVTGA